MLCTYCSNEITGEPPYGGYEGEFIYYEHGRQTVLAPERELAFCSLTCCWRYGVESHRAWGMSGKEARQHLIEVHGLTPPAPA
ncbi:hypothetical protein ES705_30155 [subsurface metagenome]